MVSRGQLGVILGNDHGAGVRSGDLWGSAADFPALPPRKDGPSDVAARSCSVRGTSACPASITRPFGGRAQHWGCLCDAAERCGTRLAATLAVHEAHTARATPLLRLTPGRRRTALPRRRRGLRVRVGRRTRQSTGRDRQAVPEPAPSRRPLRHDRDAAPGIRAAPCGGRPARCRRHRRRAGIRDSRGVRTVADSPRSATP